MLFFRTGVRALLVVGLALLAHACGNDAPAPAAAPASTAAPTTAEDAAALGRALAGRMGPPPGGYRVRRDARGRQIIDLGGRLQNATVVGTAPDGSMRLGCVGSAAQAEAFLRGAPTTTTGGR